MSLIKNVETKPLQSIDNMDWRDRFTSPSGSAACALSLNGLVSPAGRTSRRG